MYGVDVSPTLCIRWRDVRCSEGRFMSSLIRDMKVKEDVLSLDLFLLFARFLSSFLNASTSKEGVSSCPSPPIHKRDCDK